MLYSCRAIAHKFHLDPRLVKTEILSGRLPSVVIGRRRKVYAAVLDAWLTGRLSTRPVIIDCAQQTPAGAR